MGSEEAVAAMMELRAGHDGGSFIRNPIAQLRLTRQLGNVILTQDRIQDLFQKYAASTSKAHVCLY